MSVNALLMWFDAGAISCGSGAEYSCTRSAVGVFVIFMLVNNAAVSMITARIIFILVPCILITKNTVMIVIRSIIATIGPFSGPSSTV